MDLIRWYGAAELPQSMEVPKHDKTTNSMESTRPYYLVLRSSNSVLDNQEQMAMESHMVSWNQQSLEKRASVP